MLLNFLQRGLKRRRYWTNNGEANETLCERLWKQCNMVFFFIYYHIFIFVDIKIDCINLDTHFWSEIAICFKK